MSCNNENTNSLSARDKELAAIGAAIASNCIPCIEYHIPQARKVGLSDAQIREAVELADKVRRVPADKVLQTARALLAEENHVEHEDPKADNIEKNDGRGSDEGESANACGCDEATDGSQISDEAPGFDRSKMMAMMQQCCPEKMENFASMMSGFEGACCPPNEDSGPERSA